MNFNIQEADLSKDQNLIIETLRKYLTPQSDLKRFQWLYCNNPYGKARVWFIFDSRNFIAIGLCAAFPRSVWVESNESLGWVLGDFCLNSQYRSLGPALALQRACLKGLEQESNTFFYDFPSNVMMAIYRRMGIKAFGEFVRLAKPLRIDRKVQQFFGKGLFSKVLSHGGNLILKTKNSKAKALEAVTFDFHCSDFNEEFTEFDKDTSRPSRCSLQRSANYLNWRYSVNPFYTFEVLTARVNKVLQGYVIFTRADGEGTIFDIRCISDDKLISALINQVTNFLREEEIITINFPILKSHPWLTLFEGLGFIVREKIPVVMGSYPNDELLNDMGSWFLLHGDRDS